MFELEHQLRALVAAGFDLEAFERFPGFVGVVQDGFAALLQPAGDGLAQYSSTGRLINGQFALLIERSGERVFVAKGEEEPATEELLERYAAFKDRLKAALRPVV